MNIAAKNAAKIVIRDMMNRVITTRTITEPFNPEGIKNANPFGFRLVPIEIWKGSKFERSFVTSMGQKTFEQLAKVIALGSGAYASNQHVEQITMNTYRREKIDEILDEERKNIRRPDWEVELREILALNNTRYIEQEIRSDLYVRRENGTEEFYSIKTVKPNLDQTEIAKNNMLSIKAAKQEAEVYFALPYNPAGEGGNYKKIHGMPYKIFDMDNDECVLIGAEFWNKLGANDNTYNELIEVFEEVGGEYRRQIRIDYLGLED